jgi:hypothetical protein
MFNPVCVSIEEVMNAQKGEGTRKISVYVG